MPASRPPFRIAQVDPNEHGATFLGFYERSPQDATPHFRGRGVFGMQTGGNPANAISIPLYERLGFRTVRAMRAFAMV